MYSNLKIEDGIGYIRVYSYYDRLVSLICFLAIYGALFVEMKSASNYLDSYTDLLGQICSIGSILALASPIILCLRVLFKIVDAKLQWKLYTGFVANCILGIEYGQRTDNYPIIISTGSGLIIQVISLCITFGTNTTIQKIVESLQSNSNANRSNNTTQYITRIFLLTLIAVFLSALICCLIYLSAHWIPKYALGILYGVSCVFPFIAMLFSLAYDILCYRLYRGNCILNEATKIKYRSSLDIFMLFVLFVNATLWTVFGLLKDDLVIIISSMVGQCFSLYILLATGIPPLVISSTNENALFTKADSNDYYKTDSRLVNINRSHQTGSIQNKASIKGTGSIKTNNENTSGVEFLINSQPTDKNIMATHDSGFFENSTAWWSIENNNYTYSNQAYEFVGYRHSCNNKNIVIDFLAIISTSKQFLAYFTTSVSSTVSS